MAPIPHGIYDALLDEELASLLKSQPELRSVFGKLDPEEEPWRYAAFLKRVIEKILRLEEDSEKRLQLCNKIIENILALSPTVNSVGSRLVDTEKKLLLEIKPPNFGIGSFARPDTGLVESSLFTGSAVEPQLIQELIREMGSADSLDILVSFIKWSGVRLLMPALEELTLRSGSIRIITTSYMGASDSSAVEWLAKLPNVEIRVSYDTERTRLHAKAYHFRRNSGFSTAFIGSANMSHAAMTSGLEWNLKVTAMDMPHIVDKFLAEFETYWNSHDFIPFNPLEPEQFRNAINHAKLHRGSAFVFFDIRPHPFQERILEALQVERLVHNHWKNLVVAATGTGKTVIAAFDFKRIFEEKKRQVKLLYVAHRKEILEQALEIFRTILRIPDFGELLVGHHDAVRLDHLFCSVGLLGSRKLWEQMGENFYDFIIIDEVHHGPAMSYRPIFEQYKPQILLGLTATPERMDGASVVGDFGNRFAAEIRLPEALEQKLLCPFHYFGVADPISLNEDKFWKSGKYDIPALENVYTRDHFLAEKRLNAIVTALFRFEPDLTRVRAIGFCVSIRHAEYMAEKFNEKGINSAVLVGETNVENRPKILEDLRTGKISILFTRDVLNEGLDIPEVNTVLFLRPTESLTVFLQQLGRGLRHTPEKDCLTVLDFVGQSHRRYRIDRKLKALLAKNRFHIQKEVEMDFPHLPSGCSIQLDKIAKENILNNIRENLKNLAYQMEDKLKTFQHESNLPLTFANFIQYHDYEPEELLSGKKTWSQWKAMAGLVELPNDPDINILRPALLGASQINGPKEIIRYRKIIANLLKEDPESAIISGEENSLFTHYRFWGKSGGDLGFPDLKNSFYRAIKNKSILKDLDEILEWSFESSRIGNLPLNLPYPCALEIHGTYGNDEIKAALGLANFESSGQRGLGFLHCPEIKTYLALVTFQKTEKEFSPSTMYQDYPISREILHWETQGRTSQEGETGQNLIHHQKRGYTMLFFCRPRKKINGITVPFTFLGPATLESYQSNRPIQMVWRLNHPMPANMFEENRRGG